MTVRRRSCTAPMSSAASSSFRKSPTPFPNGIEVHRPSSVITRQNGEDMITRVNERVFEYYPQLRRANDYMLQHLSEPIAMRHVASAAGMAQKYFSTFFHDKTGMTCHEYLWWMRV